MGLGDESAAPRVPPTFRRQLTALPPLLEEAMADPLVAEPLASAREMAGRFTETAAEDGEDAWVAIVGQIESALERIAENHAEVLRIFGRGALYKLLLDAAFDLDRAPAALRLKSLPGYPDRPVWLIRSEGDAAAMRDAVQPGQVWVNATDLSDTQYRDLWGVVSYNRQAGLGREVPRGGRPPGSVDDARAAVIALLRENREWSNREIYDAGLRAGLWADSEPYDPDVSRLKKRVRQLRKQAGVHKRRP